MPFLSLFVFLLSVGLPSFLFLFFDLFLLFSWDTNSLATEMVTESTSSSWRWQYKRISSVFCSESQRKSERQASSLDCLLNWRDTRDSLGKDVWTSTEEEDESQADRNSCLSFWRKRRRRQETSSKKMSSCNQGKSKTTEIRSRQFVSS